MSNDVPTNMHDAIARAGRALAMAERLEAMGNHDGAQVWRNQHNRLSVIIMEWENAMARHPAGKGRAYEEPYGVTTGVDGAE